jgi:hypothetical protein
MGTLSEHHLEGRFRPALSEVARARRWTASALRGWRMAGDVPDVELVVSEMLAQAVRRGSPDIEVRLRVRGEIVRVEVHEAAFPTAEAGPLWFVSDVAAAWGRDRARGRTVTWANCRRSAEAGTGADVA